MTIFFEGVELIAEMVPSLIESGALLGIVFVFFGDEFEEGGMHVFDEPVVFVFDAKHIDDVGVFVKVDFVHLEDFFFELLNGLMGVFEMLDLILNGVFLCFEHLGNFFGGVERDEVVFDLIEGEAKIFHGEDLVEFDDFFFGIEALAVLVAGGGFEETNFVVVLEGADGDIHFFADLADSEQFFFHFILHFSPFCYL